MNEAERDGDRHTKMVERTGQGWSAEACISSLTDLHRELCSEERRETTGSHKGLRSELVLKTVYSATAGQTLRSFCCMSCPALIKQRRGSLILSQGSYRAQE